MFDRKPIENTPRVFWPSVINSGSFDEGYRYIWITGGITTFTNTFTAQTYYFNDDDITFIQVHILPYYLVDM